MGVFINNILGGVSLLSGFLVYDEIQTLRQLFEAYNTVRRKEALQVSNLLEMSADQIREHSLKVKGGSMGFKSEGKLFIMGSLVTDRPHRTLVKDIPAIALVRKIFSRFLRFLTPFLGEEQLQYRGEGPQIREGYQILVLV